MIWPREVRKQLERYDSGEYEQKRRDDVQETRRDDADSGVPLVFSGQAALHDMLAGAVVPDAHTEEAGEDTGEWKQLVLGAMEHLKLLRQLEWIPC